MVKTVRQYNTGLTGSFMLKTLCANAINHTLFLVKTYFMLKIKNTYCRKYIGSQYDICDL